MDLNGISSDIIQKIFTYLNVNEIFNKCILNVSFNSTCQKEFLWKSAIYINYGIEKCGIEDFMMGEHNNFDLVRGCENNWKATAKRLSEMKICNFEQKWVDGRTYREIAETAIKEGKGCMKYLEDMRNKIIDEIIEIPGLLRFPFYLDQYIKPSCFRQLKTIPRPCGHFVWMVEGTLTVSDLKEITIEMELEATLTKELGIIAAAVYVWMRRPVEEEMVDVITYCIRLCCYPEWYSRSVIVNNPSYLYIPVQECEDWEITEE